MATNNTDITDSPTRLVHEQGISATASSSFETDVSFTITDVTQDVLLSFEIENCALEAEYAFDTTSAVLAQDMDGRWAIRETTEYDDALNEEFTKELEALFPGGPPELEDPDDNEEPVLP